METINNPDPNLQPKLKDSSSLNSSMVKFYCSFIDAKERKIKK